ncbi:uncharacterized protein [Argopecten irradians]|uniref:uncharacterized protein n=1 Tax=Argopecten irradians TaxID=31199 RepID=UPI00371B5511
MRDWDERAMSAAIAAVKGGKSTRKAAKTYSVPKSTLSDRVTGKVLEGARMGKKKIFSDIEERELIACAKDRADMGIGFSKENFLRFAGAYASKKAIKINGGASRPSDMWWRGLKVRNKTFSLRAPEATATIRHDAMTRQRMSMYFESLGTVITTHNLSLYPERIWNMDETGMNMCHKPGRVVAKKGAKTVHAKASGTREMITIIACANAAGGCLPPHFVMPGKSKRTLYGYDTEVALETGSSIKGANYSVSDSGWTKDGIARLWFQETFLKNIGTARPQLLICDGHTSHNNVEFLDQARNEDIILVELPSHTSNWTQPLDRTVFKSLKSHWNTEVTNFIRTTGVSVGHKQFLRIFGKAWKSALTPNNIKSGFAATGICPFNPEKIPTEAYKPSESCNDSEEHIPSYTTNSTELASQTTPSQIQSRETLPNSFLSPSRGSDHTVSSNPSEVSLPGSSDVLLSQNTSGMSLPINPTDLQVDPEENVVSLINFSLPLNNGISDLPGLNIDQEGNLQIEPSDDCLPLSSPSCEVPVPKLNVVSPKTALEVVESAISDETLLKFQAAHLAGKVLRDPMFETWKMYQSKVTQMNPPAVNPETVAKELFPVPKMKPINVTSHFVLTSDEIYMQKKHARDEKNRKELEKEQRKVERENKRLLREKEKENKINRRKRKQ